MLNTPSDTLSLLKDIEQEMQQTTIIKPEIAFITERDVFKFLVKDEEDNSKEHIESIKNNLAVFCKVIPNNGIRDIKVFKDEYAVIYEILKIVNSVGGIINYKIFYNVLYKNIEGLVKNLKINTYQITKQKDTEQQLKAFFQLCLTEYLELSKLSKTDDFNTIFQLFLQRKKDELYNEVLLKCSEISKEGFIKAHEYYNETMAFINSMQFDKYDTGILDISTEGYNTYKKLLTSNSFKPVVSFGIKEVDKVIGDLCTCQLVTLMGDTGGGKTKNAINLAYRALMRGKKVLFYSLEVPQVAVINQFITRHIYQQWQYPINPKSISKGTLTKEEISYVDLATKQLFNLTNGGQLRVEKGPLYVETFTDEIKSIYREWGNIDMIVIDYPALMQSLTGKKPTEIVTEAYIKLKNLINYELGDGALAITISQLTRETIKESYNIAEEGKGEIGTTGARMSQEVVNSSDIVISIVSTLEMRRKGIIQYIQNKGRDDTTFSPFKARAIFESCIFLSQDGEDLEDSDV